MIEDAYLVFGAGAYVSVVDDILHDIYEESTKHYKIIGFIDSDPNKINGRYYGYKVLGGIDFIENIERNIFGITFITNQRKKLVENINKIRKIEFPNIIHSSAIISKSANIGRGNIIGHNVVISANVKIGNYNHINYSVTIGHDCKIGEQTHLANGVAMAGSSKIGKRCFIGSGSCFKPAVKISDDIVVGIGSVVVKNCDKSESVLFGNPAKILKWINIYSKLKGLPQREEK